MFSLVSGIYDSYLAPSQLNLLVVGAPSAGKTTLLERLKVTQMPKRPSKDPESSAQPMTMALHDAFVEGGARSPHKRATPSPPQNDKNDNTIADIPPPSPAPKMTQKRRFPISICPAPERYLKSSQDQDEEFVEDDIITQATQPTASVRSEEPTKATLQVAISPVAPRLVRCHSKEFNIDELDDIGIPPIQNPDFKSMDSMESVPMEDPASPRPPAPQDETTVPHSDLLETRFAEYNLKPNAKMLPMSKIRPTIGTNLGKIEMYGAKCKLFDVGGRLQDLWERYYDDCDAVVFCWRLGEDPDNPPPEEEDDEEDPFVNAKQHEVLMQVRKSIPDDVPFLIFGHVFGNVHVDLVDQMYSTDLLLPLYHNNLTGLCCGSAKTGAGVQSAMEWLIPLAKRQQKDRLAARKQLEEKL